MPEGNEIHRFAENHARVFARKRVRVDSPNGGFPDAEILDGRKLARIDAVGKHLGYHFGRDLILHIHLGMFGDFHQGEIPLPPARGALRLRIYTKTDWIELRGGTDTSIFGHADWQALLKRLGPDPLIAGSDPEPAFEKIAKRDTPIGALLMDQSVIAGIGNIYRAEILYRARIHPLRPGREVDHAALKGIWRDAKKLMGAGVRDTRYVTTLAKDRPHKTGPVREDEERYVYRRHGKPCFVCGTKIQRADLAGRTIYWCPKCQKN
ncbi:Fpg/Nei family DNA glycosylase [Alloacidobacterium dinghuense]|uniref:DNA-(apurinic or apyrimidinic site) lyase n=1 Tax=Alloacidobacterium dinghuense TaxID=2763107 RepID=A0A7G8BIC7_9BACT|nr:Fpg/Nei family DNA glycosylase [Alloacidobacterium dinghuense]QNI32297.1 Fpg/Nei family DNA glycosylase [Alloacidobacterium dinghuense]